MTNIFAVAVPEKNPEYIFCAADSQATSPSDGTKDSNAQKMVQRGNNILMETGAAFAAQIVYDRLLGKDMPPLEMAECILKETEDLSKKLEEIHSPSLVFVAGKNKDRLEMYAVQLCNAQTDQAEIKRGIKPVESLFSKGSGSRHVIPAILRDHEKGFFIHPSTPLEALALCFGVGAKADTDLGVNEKLQIGIIGKTFTRLMLPPSVRTNSYDEFNQYFTNLTGYKFDITENTTEQRKKEVSDILYCICNFYNAIESQMHRFLSEDDYSNQMHSKFKIGKTDIDSYLASIKDRQETAKKAQVFLDALMKGGLKNMNDATREFYKNQEEILRAAEKVISQEKKYCEYPTSSQ